MRRLLLASVLVTLFVISQFSSAGAAEYSVGTKFTYDIDVRMRGTSADYSGYTEQEDEIRTYEVMSVNSTDVEWKLDRDLSYSSNEGDRYEDKSTYIFYTSVDNRAYTKSSDIIPDWDGDYYTADFMWFRIHPDEVTPGDMVPILGNDYEYIGEEAVLLDTTTAVTALKFVGSGVTDVFNNEYDPDGHLVLEFTETMYFDPETGYLLRSTWLADGFTSIGNFDWEENVVLTQSTFVVVNDWKAWIAANWTRLIVTGLLLGGLILVLLSYRYRWRRDVQNALDLITGKKSTGYNEDLAPNTWSPLEMNYKYLLDDHGDEKKHSLKDGIFLIVETHNRLVLADTLADQYIGSYVFDLNRQNLPMMYRLALGNIGAGTSEAAMLRSKANSMLNYYQTNKSSQLFQLDRNALAVFMKIRQSSDPRYAEIAELLARRKVLDYSHGQAPLSPSSHLKKLDQVMHFSPDEVFLVGDDDLLSVSLARRGVSVVLVEIDPYTCALIESIRLEESLPIRISQVDLRDPLPSQYENCFDLFVADPDFTIASFLLFLSRGMASLKVGGKALINFEGSIGQNYRVRYSLSKLQTPVLEVVREKWYYTIVQNKKIPIRGYRYGKYTVVDYANDLVLSQATYSSRMYILEKTQDTLLAIAPQNTMAGPKTSIYDY